MTDLHIPATAELLDGWCGPVLWLRGGGECVTLHARGYSETNEVRVHDDEGLMYAPIAEVSLDLARAEVRDRVARVHNGRPAMLTYFEEHLWFGDEAPEPWPDDIDPHDDTRLPDGSRLVDALALKAVWEVCRG